MAASERNWGLPSDPAERDLNLVLRRRASANGAVSAIASFHPHDRAGHAQLLATAGCDPSGDTPALLLAVARAFVRRAARRGDIAASPFRMPAGDEPEGVRCDVLAVAAQGYVLITQSFAIAQDADRASRRELAEDSAAGAFFRLWLSHRTVCRQARGLSSALDASGWSIFVLDHAKQILFSNREGTALLGRANGLRLAGRSLAATGLSDAFRLQVTLDHIANLALASDRSQATMPFLIQRSEGRPLIVTIMPVEATGEGESDAAMIVYVVDPEVDIEPLLQPVCELFQLSPAEGRLTVLIATGQPLADAAKTLRIKEPTARTYLKQIFLKTDTRRQADLVRVMMSSIVRISRSVAGGGRQLGRFASAPPNAPVISSVQG